MQRIADNGLKIDLHIHSSESSKKDGKKVVKIQENAFDGNEKITEVVIPEGLTEICEFSFKVCKNLKTVNIPSTVKEVDGSAFIGCDALEFTEEKGLFYLGNGENAYHYLSHANKTVESATINDECKIIGYGAFENCNSLNLLNIPKKLFKINGYAFAGADSLRTLNYFGLEEDWKKILLDDEWMTGGNLYAVVVYGGQINLR
jgi:hypothetical protein